MSRQREFLADASAVQFTRNPDGLAGALKRIGAAAVGLAADRRPTPLKRATCFSPRRVGRAHAAHGHASAAGRAHPPARPAVGRQFPPRAGDAGRLSRKLREQARPASSAASAARRRARGRREARRRPSGRSHRTAPPICRGAGRLAAAARCGNRRREPYGARAVLLGLLTDRKPAVREQQLAKLRELAPADLVELTLKLLPWLDALDVRARLPLVDLVVAGAAGDVAVAVRAVPARASRSSSRPTIGWGCSSGRCTASCCGTCGRSSRRPRRRGRRTTACRSWARSARCCCRRWPMRTIAAATRPAAFAKGAEKLPKVPAAAAAAGSSAGWRR